MSVCRKIRFGEERFRKVSQTMDGEAEDDPPDKEGTRTRNDVDCFGKCYFGCVLG